MAAAKSNPSPIASPKHLEPDPIRIQEMEAQGLEVLKLAHVTFGEDLGPLLEKAGKITTKTEEDPASPSKPCKASRI
jgi:hypothetical protein